MSKAIWLRFVNIYSCYLTVSVCSYSYFPKNIYLTSSVLYPLTAFSTYCLRLCSFHISEKAHVKYVSVLVFYLWQRNHTKTNLSCKTKTKGYHYISYIYCIIIYIYRYLHLVIENRYTVLVIELKMLNSVWQFLYYLEIVRWYDPKTIKQYKYCVRDFVRYMVYLWIGDFSEIRVSHIELYKKQLISRKENNTTFRYISCVRWFFKYLRCFISDCIDYQSIENVSYKKTEQLYVTYEEYKQLLKDTKGDNYLQSFILLCFTTGLRASEALNLTHNNIQGNRIVVIGKNKQQITVATPSMFLYRIADSPTERLFPYSYENTRRKYKRYTDKKIHSLRHWFATHLYEKWMPLESIQKAMHHKILKSTLEYIHPSEAHLSKQMSTSFVI